MKNIIKVIFLIILLTFSNVITLGILSTIFKLNIWPCTFDIFTLILYSCPKVFGQPFKIPVVIIFGFLLIISIFIIYKSKKNRLVRIIVRFFVILGIFYAISLSILIYKSEWRNSCKSFPTGIPSNKFVSGMEWELRCQNWYNPFDWKRIEIEHRKIFPELPAIGKTYQTEKSYDDLTGKINVTIFERPVSSSNDYSNEGQKNITVKLTTEKEFGCAGYEIDSYSGILEDQVIIVINNIVPPGEICATMKAPAVYSKDFGELNGNYSLIIGYNGKEDIYNLKIDNEYIHAESLVSSFTRLTESKITRLT